MITAIVVFILAASAATAPTKAPDFPFKDMKGNNHTLAEMRGQVVLLEFWAPWCIPCRKGFPFLDQLQAKHESAGLKVVAVTMETDDDSVSEFLRSYPGRFLVGRDVTGHAGELYDVTAMPTTVLLDREGNQLARFEGGTETVHQQVETAVAAALAGGGTAPAANVTIEPVPTPSRRQGARRGVRAWERGYLADRIMNLDGDPLTRSMREHVHTSKEAAAGNGGVAGGGCGCN